MKILITGGTGFVGSHVCRQLLANGHSVRLLVRNTEKAGRVFEALHSDALELFAGDITDQSAVQHALQGCDGVIHAAAATPMQIESIDALFAVNVGGVKNVVGAAIEQGIDRIVCVSSVTAIFNADGSKVTADAPPTPSKMPYGQTKVESEIFLRELQALGHPVSIVYPGGIIGPNDPGFSDSCKAIKHRVENGFRIFGDGGMQYIDVRDLATFLCSLVIEGGAGRFLLPGVFSTWVEQADMIEEVSGAQLQRIDAKGWKLRLVGRMMDIARLVKKNDSPISAETMRYATQWPNIQNTDELLRRGIELRAARESFDDTLRWMVDSGHLDAKTCPRYAETPTISTVL